MTRNIQATDAQGNKVNETIQINGVDPTSSGGGGAFEDGDGDGVYTLPNAGDGINVGSVDTDTLTFAGRALDSILEGQSTGLREEHGQASQGDPGVAADDTWGSNTASTTAVTFGTAFSATPIVITDGPGQAGAVYQRQNLSTTGFDCTYVWYRSTGSTGNLHDWLALGSE